MSRLVVGFLVLCAAASAQDFVGFSYNSAVGAASRGTLGNEAGEVLTRIDGSACAAWGGGAPGFRVLHSVGCVVQDRDVATPETFAIKLYPEDVARPGYPDLTAGVVFAENVAGPTGESGAAAELRLTTPAAPVAVAVRGGGDVFLAFVLPVASATDGLSIQVVLGFSPGAGFATFDTPSLLQGGTPVPAGSPETSHFLTRKGTTLTYNTRRQGWVDVAHAGAGGQGLAITNQTSFACSHNPAPLGFGPWAGTADFLSGSTPDVAGNNAGRADDVAMWFRKNGLGSGRLVVFLLDRDFSANWGAEVAAGSVFPGALGLTCLVDPEIVAFVASVNGEAVHVTPIPEAVRGQLAGLVGKQQAAAFDANGVLHVGPGDAMRF